MIRQTRNVHALSFTISRFINPFDYDGNDTINIVSKALMPDAVKSDLCRIEEIGTLQMKTFIENPITTSKINLWEPMKKAPASNIKSIIQKNYSNHC